MLRKPEELIGRFLLQDGALLDEHPAHAPGEFLFTMSVVARHREFSTDYANCLALLPKRMANLVVTLRRLQRVRWRMKRVALPHCLAPLFAIAAPKDARERPVAPSRL